MVRSFLAAAFLTTGASAAALKTEPLTLDAIGAAAQPSLTTDGDRGFVLSWQSKLGDGCVALRAAALSARGRLGPVREVARGCDWFVNWADFPSLLVTENGDWVSFWLQKSGDGTYAYDVRATRSRDQGLSWSAPTTIHDDGTPTEHGFVSMARAGNDRVLMVWLDGRHTGGAHDHDHHGDAGGNMTLRSAVFSRTDVLTHQHEIDNNVCSCCPTDLVRLHSGEFRVVFRNRTDDEVRDIGMARFDGTSWHDEGIVHPDLWTIAACPVNGPAIATRGTDTLVAWATMGGGAGLAVRAKLSSGAMRELERGDALGRVDAVAFGDDWLITWLGDAADGTTLRLARFNSALAEQSRVAIAALPRGRDIGMPKLAANGSVAMLVWTESSDGGPRIVGRRLTEHHRTSDAAAARRRTDTSPAGGNLQGVSRG